MCAQGVQKVGESKDLMPAFPSKQNLQMNIQRRMVKRDVKGVPENRQHEFTRRKTQQQNANK
jgi:hypothetical protein